MKPTPALTVLVATLAMGPPAGLAHDATHAGAQHKAFEASHPEETAFGRAADPAKASRVIRIGMDDTMRYEPSRITIKRGDSVRLVVTNRGKQMHELVLGTRAELERHADMMRKHPGMDHREPHMLHVAPGKTGEIGWRFTKAGEFQYGCLLPGHFEAGMVGTVVVTDK